MRPLAAHSRKTLIQYPFFSICVPQFNRTSFLIEACRSIARQTFRDCEICISDDCSTDGRSDELLNFLRGLDISFAYRRQPQNTRYDGNLRSAIELASGKFCFLLGNDDALASSKVLEELHDRMLAFEAPGVVITNYRDYGSGQTIQRVKGEHMLGADPSVAVQNFRNFSFVSGIVLDAAKVKSVATERWDGSEFYQMFVASRMIAGGASLVTIDLVTVRKDIRITGEDVDSYRARPRLKPCPIVERRINLVTIGSLVADAIQPYVENQDMQRTVTRIFLQLLTFTYPFWIYEYRRVQSWKYALGVCLAMRPRRILRGHQLSPRRRLSIAVVYGLVTTVGLITPVMWFQRLYPQLHRFAKSFGHGTHADVRV